MKTRPKNGVPSFVFDAITLGDTFRIPGDTDVFMRIQVSVHNNVEVNAVKLSSAQLYSFKPTQQITYVRGDFVET